MQFVLASSNSHKADEIKAMVPDIELCLQSDLGVQSPPETGSTFIENALIKARHASEVTGMPAIADDSGICVNALDGAPGIFSARYAGEGASDEDNLNKLLHDMSGITDRTAGFCCVLVCLNSARDPRPLIAEGFWPGEIAARPAGSGGFGYDPVFIVPGTGQTAAQLAPDQKNAISHRGLALKALVEKLRERYSA